MLGTNQKRMGRSMVNPLYACRLEDLGPEDRIRVACRCGHVALVDPETCREKLFIAPFSRILDLERHFRCASCRRRGQALVGVVWA